VKVLYLKIDTGMIRASESTNTTVAPSTETVGGIAPETGSSISSESEDKGKEEKSAPYNTNAIRLEL
jgi:hypothetical protein